MSALTIGGSYVIGGLVPLLPYMLVSNSKPALYISSVVTALALFIFGAVKGALTGVSWLRSAVQTVIIGGVAATAGIYHRQVGGQIKDGLVKSASIPFQTACRWRRGHRDKPPRVSRRSARQRLDTPGSAKLISGVGSPSLRAHAPRGRARAGSKDASGERASPAPKKIRRCDSRRTNAPRVHSL